MSKPIRLLAVTRKPTSPSYEQRVLNFITPLGDRGIDVTPFHMKRVLPRDLSAYDGVWWHRSILGWWTVQQLDRITLPMVFDFDDPLSFSSEGGGKISRTRQRRFAWTLKRMTAAMPGSSYLDELATPYCDDRTIVPMACDIPDLGADTKPAEPVQLLWVGSRATQPYLDAIREALEVVGKAHNDVSLRLVAHEPMDFPGMPVDFREWSHDEQEAGLRECHVGLCPMPDTPWTRGKCPYKVLQYMSYAMAWVGSDVGENRRTAGDAERGLVAGDTAGWVNAITRLIDDAEMRNRLGQSARTFIEAKHSRDALADRIAGVFRRLIRQA